MNGKDKLHAKINYLQGQLESLKDYFFVNETYQYLLSELDACQVELKRLEVQEQFAAIESGNVPCLHSTPSIRS